MESMRGMDYIPSSAIADLVDNSISAGADHVKLQFHLRSEECPEPLFFLEDNGSGMNHEELLNAMRLGVINPKAVRDTKDLGRFGLGLKTASFSQCRRLTVYSVQNEKASCLCWDLDQLCAEDENCGWSILEGAIPELPILQEHVQNLKQGTIVIWEKMDRFLPSDIDEDDFFKMISEVELYLRLYFHRFLEKKPVSFKIMINDRALKPLNPFMENNPATRTEPEQRIGNGTDQANFQGFILPHRDKMTPEEYRDGGALNGWIAHEGFYVYRNERLLLAGSWLGLGYYGEHGKKWNRDEIHQLVRIRLDISNKSDDNWKIDIRKSSARPPFAIREELTLLADKVRRKARQVFVYRGGYEKKKSENSDFLWTPINGTGGKISYRINQNHPIVKSVLTQAGGMAEKIRELLLLLENSVPVQKIWLDTAEEKNVVNSEMETLPPKEQMERTRKFFVWLMESGYTPNNVQEILAETPPFNSWKNAISAVKNELLSKGE